MLSSAAINAIATDEEDKLAVIWASFAPAFYRTLDVKPINLCRMRTVMMKRIATHCVPVSGCYANGTPGA